MRIRTIKPEFWMSESLSRVSIGARLLFIGLWSCCDDSGRARASSRLLASLLFPYGDVSAEQISEWMAELSAEGMVRAYICEGNHYLDIPKWLSHQRIDRPSKSRIPGFDEGSRVFDDGSRSLVLGREGKGREGNGGENHPPHTKQETNPALFRWLKGCDRFLSNARFMAGIGDVMDNLQAAYPETDFANLPQEAHSWLLANPHKPKKNLLSFFRNWVARQAKGWENAKSNNLGGGGSLGRDSERADENKKDDPSPVAGG